MRQCFLPALVLSVLLSAVAGAADYTLTVDKPTLSVGETCTVTVLAKVPSAEAFCRASQFLRFDPAMLQLTAQAAGNAADFRPDTRPLDRINDVAPESGGGEVRAGVEAPQPLCGELTLGVFTFTALRPGATDVSSAPYEPGSCDHGNVLRVTADRAELTLVPATPPPLALAIGGAAAGVSTRNADIITNTGSVSVNEGATATFQVKLSDCVPCTVTVARTVGDESITVSGGASLTFTVSNWDTFQTVTLAAASDADHDDGSATITIAGTGVNSGTITAQEVDSGSSHDTPPAAPVVSGSEGGGGCVLSSASGVALDTLGLLLLGLLAACGWRCRAAARRA